MPIVVVDIQKMERRTVEVNGKRYTLTPREKLLPLITAIAAQHPKAIGIDIDFAPNEFGYMDTQNDPTFFRSLSELNVPVFIGIGRSHGEHPRYWLGVPEFRKLAADIVVPEDERKMYKWVETSKDSSTGVGKGPSLSAALADPFRSKPVSRGPFRWALTLETEVQIEPSLKGSEFLVDFSALQEFQDMRITTIDPAVVGDFGWTMGDKAVLIGDGVTYDSRDTYPVPTLTHRRGVPGIYKHAAAAYTLIKAPLYELTGIGRVFVDFLLSAMVLVPLALLRVLVARKTRNNRLAEESTMVLLTAVVTIIVFVVGVIFVHYTRTIWDDFLFVILALWIHRPVAHGIERLVIFLKNLPATIANISSKSNEGEQP
jgi:CHASE2 domain-containing sensor protein